MKDWDSIRKKRAKERRQRKNKWRRRHWTGARITDFAVLKAYYEAIQAAQKKTPEPIIFVFVHLSKQQGALRGRQFLNAAKDQRRAARRERREEQIGRKRQLGIRLEDHRKAA